MRLDRRGVAVCVLLGEGVVVACVVRAGVVGAVVVAVLFLVTTK